MAPNKKEVIKTKVEKLAKQGDIDVHLAAKVSQRLVSSLAKFKSKLHNFSFGSSMDKFFDWVPEQYIMQQLPEEIDSFRTYLTRFHRGSSNSVLAFIKWVEWAQYENNKDKHFAPKKGANADEDEGDEIPGEEKPKEQRKRSRTAAREELARTVKGREHVRALLQMCLRHNSTRRKEGVNSLVNHLRSLCSEMGTFCRSYEELKSGVDSSVSYALARLVLGMVGESLFTTVLNCAALSSVLAAVHTLSPGILLSLLEEEMALPDRMRAFMAHQRKKQQQRDKEAVTDANVAQEEEDVVDPDRLADPTRGERNQRLAAIVFTAIAILSSGQTIRMEDAREMVKMMAFCYVEHRGLRVLSANVMLALLRNFPQFLTEEETWSWIQVAFFKFHKLDYIRPEGIQLILFSHAREGVTKPQSQYAEVASWFNNDPLEPSMMEKIGSALFRREHVTECHPAIHPVWDDYFQLVANRCAAGESVKVHLTNIVHNLIAPYRRGASDHPRAVLFRKLLERISHLALLNADEFDRADVVQEASKTIGWGRGGKVGKATDPATLRAMSVDELFAKAHSLIRQYRSIKDSDPGANSFRSWSIRELRACLSVEYHKGIDVPYVNDALRFFFEAGFFTKNSRDQRNIHRCIFNFADILSFTYSPKNKKSRPKASVPVLELMDRYLEAEAAGKTMYNTAVNDEKFGKARSQIEKALRGAKYSVLFYEDCDMQNMLFIVFLIVSIDDPSNSEAVSRAETVVPDLARFYRKGTFETLAVFYDLMMSLCASTSCPMQVMPLMAIIRRLCTGFVVRFSRYVTNRAPLDMILAPLVEAFHTDEREAIRLAMMEQGEEEEEESDEEGTSKKSKRARLEGGKEGAFDEDEDAETTSSDEDTDTDFDEEEEDTATEADDDEEEGEEEDEEDEDASDSSSDEASSSDNDEWAGEFEEEEKPTEAYLNTLKSMVKDKNDPDHQYPSNDGKQDKADVVRIVQLSAKVGLKLRSPMVVHIFQVLLGVLRNCVKDHDDVISNSVRSSIETLFLSKNRYFGYFCGPQDLYQLLGDVQAYMHKTERSITAAARDKNRSLAVKGGVIKRRLFFVKRLSLSVVHYLGFLAHKNHAVSETKQTFVEYWKTFFCEKGWDMKFLMPFIKQDLYRYRHGFAWIFLPAAMEKALDLRKEEGAKRARTFIGAYAMIEAFLPRISGLPTELKQEVGVKIREFFEAMPLEELFEISHTMLFHYFHCLRMTLEYNSKVGLDRMWVEGIVAKATDDDSIQMTKASAVQLSKMERMLGIEERILNIKPCTPFGVLHKQHATTWRKKKSRFYKKVRSETKKTLDAVLAVRTDEPTADEQRSKRKRREHIRIQDKTERRRVRQEFLDSLTKEEKLMRRKNFKKEKQDRMAANKKRKAVLSVRRKKDFDDWREKKLAQAEEQEAE